MTKHHIIPERPEWYEVSCCPPNLQSALAGLDGYIYYASEDTLYVGLFVSGKTTLDVGGKQVGLTVDTKYPFGSTVDFTVDYDGELTLAIRQPAWAEAVALTVNGEAVNAENEKGMLLLRRVWKSGDRVRYTIDMKPRLVVSNPKVRANAGCCAIMRGPLLYCLEETDNGANLAGIALYPDAEFTETFEPELLGGTLTLSFPGVRVKEGSWFMTELYRTYRKEEDPVTVKAIPYSLWQNRGRTELKTWIPLR